MRSTQFWNKVRARREANEETVRIKKPAVHRAELVLVERDGPRSSAVIRVRFMPASAIVLSAAARPVNIRPPRERLMGASPLSLCGLLLAPATVIAAEPIYSVSLNTAATARSPASTPRLSETHGSGKRQPLFEPAMAGFALPPTAVHVEFPKRAVKWGQYPSGWAAEEPGPGPYALRGVLGEAARLTRADFERARLDYLAWFKERHEGYFWSELADAKGKAYSRRTARFPHVPAEYDRDTMRGRSVLSPALRQLMAENAPCGSWDEQEGLDIGDDNDTKGSGVIVQGTTGIAREEWNGFEVSHHPMPTVLPADQRLCARILDKSPGRNRGRPPISGRAMTDAERKRRHRAKETV